MARFALVLGGLSAIGPFAIDMYLPAMPAIGRALHTSDGQVQMSLMSFFIGITFGQLLYGPLSDKFGRRPPVFLGLTVFVLASAACALAPNIAVLIGARLIQGLGASAGCVIGTAIIRDLFTGAEAARMMVLRMLVLSVSPVLAPLTGASVVAVASWRVIFWITGGLGLACIAMVAAFLPETHAPERRTVGRIAGAAAKAYAGVIRDRRLMGLALGAALGQGSFFAYLSGSSFVLIENHHLSPMLFSLVFSVNAAGLIGAAQFVPNMMRWIGAERLIRIAMTVQATTVSFILVAALLHVDSLWVLIPALFIAITAYGMAGAPTVVLALRDYAVGAGTASAVVGAVQVSGGVVTTGLVGALANGTDMPMIAVLAGCGVGSLAVYLTVLRGRPEAVATASS